MERVELVSVSGTGGVGQCEWSRVELGSVGVEQVELGSVDDM